ncbi:poly(U)-binding-splicing factor PUF60-B-like isoform X2 [Zophobas morio]|uniref:poly(U)-binding-splicing factor PUF60-B-like isoform X2 n=1 Tax=Zophobas morio TaxID=2755281 RepID=UPI003082DA74
MVSCVEEKKSQDEHYYKQLNPEAKHLNNISENSLNKDMEENFSTQTNLSKETVTNIGANSGLTTEQEQKIKKAKEYAETLRKAPFVPLSQTLQTNPLSVEIQKQQERQRAIQLMCRIYVGSINFDLGEPEIRLAFENFGPIRNVDLQLDPITLKHKGFCFLEFEIPEAAILALSALGQIALGGRVLKIGRPTNAPQARPIIEEIQKEALTHAGIYIACINPELDAEDIATVFEAFGPIKSCKLGYDLGNPKHKGYGYILYESMESCQEAVANMNNFDLGGRLLKVCRAITPPMPDLLGTARGDPKIASGTSHLFGVGPGLSATAARQLELEREREQREMLEKKNKNALEYEENVHISSIQDQLLLMQKLARNTNEYRVIVLRNMVGTDDVDEYLEEEIVEECEKYGKTEKVFIHCDKNPQGDPIVKIFVKFTTAEGAQKAQKSLHERWFAGRQVLAEFYDEKRFDKKDFYG